jgi:hypothetical protein
MNETDNNDTPRSPDQIARRAIALHCAIAAARGVSKLDISEWLQKEGLWEELTPRELRFMKQEENPGKEVSQMTWFVEAQVALLWAIQKINALPPVTDKCDTKPVVDAMPGLFQPTKAFIESSSLRDPTELRREEEELYDVRCELAKILRNGKPPPGSPDEHVAFFRHYGLSWVVGYCGQAWDEITPDT